ncbi:MAG TPA: 50S ribosomal protein L10 [Candidatus Saccharimonadales bacterium]|nr:50S ribosomal protein L10 [Candidatus Saccharimonadales bacterium]
MAISKDKKAEILADTKNQLENAKLTVFAFYAGTPVKAMQELRRDALEGGTSIRVIKNRLFKKVLSETDRFKGVDTSVFNGQLLYAFNDQDEVAPAQALASFAKEQPQIQFAGGLNAEGQLLAADDVKDLAALPSKDVLRAQLAGTIGAPLSGFANVMSGSIRGVINVLNARADQL